MHPKPLQLICIEKVVDATLAYQHSCQDVKALWTGVQQAWTLPPGVLSQAHDLLHTNLLHQHQHAPDHTRQDVTRPLLILLAFKAREIAFLKISSLLLSLASPSDLTECGVYEVDHSLCHLDLSGVDLAESTDSVLVSLLPRCPNLTVLKLEGNTTPRVLQAAKNCPLSVLHINERQVYAPRVSLLNLMESVLGCRNLTVDEVLERMERGDSLYRYITPTWPKLIDFSVGYCRIPLEFLIIVLVVYPNLQYLWSKSFGSMSAIREYQRMCRSLKGELTLSLKSRGEIERGQYDPSFDMTPKVEQLHLRTDSLGNLSGDSLLQNLPTIKTLIISMRTSCYPSFLTPNEVTTTLRGQITTLKLIGSVYVSLDVQVLKDIMKIFNFLENVSVEYYKELELSPSIVRQEVLYFHSVTSFTCSLELLDEPLFCFLPLFPKLKFLSVTSKLPVPIRFWECLNGLPELRILKVVAPRDSLDIARLCSLPRRTQDKQPWELYMPLLDFTAIQRLRNNGWVYYPC